MRKLRELLRRVRSRLMGGSWLTLHRQLVSLERRLQRVQEAVGRVESRQVAALPEDAPLAQREFQVHSQWGEDGLIDHLVRHVPVERQVFVEFGVESYDEANTRFLLTQQHWAGLVIEADRDRLQRLRQSSIYWRHNLKAVDAMVTRDNINELLQHNGVTGPIGLLSIDIDGMDFWVWQAIERIEPAIVVIEYNHRFGPEASVSTPYAADFDRRAAHHSICYYGASLEALHRLGRRKGYDLVGCGSAGLNAFFVRRDRRPPAIAALTTAEAFVAGGFSEYHDEAGVRRKRTPREEAELIEKLPLVEIDERGEVREPRPALWRGDERDAERAEKLAS